MTCYSMGMDVTVELAKIAERFPLWHRGYTLEALDYVLQTPDLTDGERVELARVVLARNFDLRDEL